MLQLSLLFHMLKLQRSKHQIQKHIEMLHKEMDDNGRNGECQTYHLIQRVHWWRQTVILMPMLISPWTLVPCIVPLLFALTACNLIACCLLEWLQCCVIIIMKIRRRPITCITKSFRCYFTTQTIRIEFYGQIGSFSSFSSLTANFQPQLSPYDV